jgi:hypothetical protein
MQCGSLWHKIRILFMAQDTYRIRDNNNNNASGPPPNPVTP